MAAPSGIVWGSIVGGYGRIGIYTSLSSTATTTTASVQVWFWSKYGVSDSNNNFYFDNLSGSGSAITKKGSVSVSTTVSSGDGWSTSNQVRIGTYSFSYGRGATSAKRYIYAKLADIDRVGGTMYASATITIPSLQTYAITYNANGGSGAPGNQSKVHGTTLKLSSTKPTRTGYNFLGWATSASGSVAYAAGANYTTDGAITLYAVWQAKTYTVSYNANGGSGAPGNQTKTYGVTLKLSSTIPTRALHTFKGWATYANATSAVYSAGGNYTPNNDAVLYAVWELNYTAPRIFNVSASRSDSAGRANDSGTYALVKFEWETTLSVQSVVISWASAAASPGNKPVTATGTSGSVSTVIGSALSPDASYTVTVTVKDSSGESQAVTMLNGAGFPIDVMPGGRGLGFGKPAELAGVADFGLAAKFREPVFGNVLGLNKLPEIPSGSDFNDYMSTGSWAVYKNANAENIANIPVNRAGRLEVNSATGEGIRQEQWSYLRQRFIPYNSSNATWERDISRDEDNVWHFYDWYRSTLSMEASARVYKTPTVLWTGGWYMTAGHTATLSELVSAQNNGIVLVFSQYSTQADNSWWSSFFVPKEVVADYVTTGHCFVMAGGNFSRVAMKYLYIHNDKIVGHDNNKLTGTTNGITFNTGAFVMRYVIGV